MALQMNKNSQHSGKSNEIGPVLCSDQVSGHIINKFYEGVSNLLALGNNTIVLSIASRALALGQLYIYLVGQAVWINGTEFGLRFCYGGWIWGRLEPLILITPKSVSSP
jgi:hypothetical protein